MNDELKPSPDSAPRKLGVWVDHRIAKFVELRGDQVRCSEIRSDLERKHRSTGGFKMPGKAYIKSTSASEKHMNRKNEEHLRRFYQDVLKTVEQADRFVLLGPGQAKTGLLREIKQSQTLAPRLAAVMTTEDMTERQLIAKVKEFFH